MKDKVEMNEMNPLKQLSSLSEDSNISEAIMSTLYPYQQISSQLRFQFEVWPTDRSPTYLVQ